MCAVYGHAVYTDICVMVYVHDVYTDICVMVYVHVCAWWMSKHAPTSQIGDVECMGEGKGGMLDLLRNK